MIPTKLTIKGLYSYQEQQIIDFEQLIQGQLFGIFGAVGSGKSSILEAITFAIFGETDRMNAREQRNYNMMNLKSDEIWIDLECLNYKNDKLKFTVKGRRNAKNFLDVRTFERKAYLFTQSEWLPIELHKSLQLIGISYENFRRTIIIPQGRFKEFLELGNKDRTGMLKELFQLDRFDLQSNVNRLDSENNAQLQIISGQLMAYEDLSEAQILQLKEDVLRMAQEAEILASELAQLQQKTSQIESQFNLQKELFKYKAELSELQEDELKFKLLETKISKMETAKNLFQDVLTKINLLDQQVQNQTQLQSQFTQELADLHKELDHSKKELDLIQPEFDNLALMEHQLKDAEIMVKLTELVREFEKQKERIVNGNKYLEEKKDAIASTQTIVLNLRQSIQDIENTLESKAHYSKVEVWYERMDTQKLHQKSLEQNMEKLQKELEDIQQKRNACQLKIESTSSLIKEQLISLGYQEDNHNNQSWQIWLSDHLNKLSLQLELETLAADLSEGNPCPLCGSTHHPQVHQNESVKRDFETWKAIQVKLEELDIDLLKLSEQKQFLDQNLKTYHGRKDEMLIELNKQKSLLESIAEECPDRQFKYDQKDQFLMALEQYHKDREELIQKRLNIKKREGEYNQLTVELDRYQSGLAAIQTKISELEGKVEAVKENLSLPFETFDIHSNWSAISDTLSNQIKDIANKYQQATQRHTHIQQQIMLKAKELESSSLTLQSLEQNLSISISTLKTDLKNSEFNSIEEVKNAMYSVEAWNQDKKELQAYLEKLQVLHEKVKYINAQITLETITQDLIDQLKDQIKQLHDKHLTITKNQAQTQGQLDQKQKDLAHKIELDKLKNTLTIRKDNLAKMNSLFRASGFVNYISSVYLQELCAAANERFYKLTRQQLKLEVDPENNFIIRDYLHDGNIRSINTLSGGQTFQASLCLALALSDSISNFSQSSRNFFFLDEGFGSLDKSSLATVFETLKSLRKENRIVGIISHVEEMQQEIDTFITIINDTEKGSQIKNSWQS